MNSTKDEVAILIVEDSITQAKSLERLLAANDYSVVSAMDGKEGYEAAVEHGPAISPPALKEKFAGPTRGAQGITASP